MLVGLFLVLGVRAQTNDGGSVVAYFMASKEKFGAAKNFSGTLTWTKGEGDARYGRFVVAGEKFSLKMEDSELIGNGTYTWEILHRSKRIKKRHYDPFTAPAVVFAFRFYKLNLLSEYVTLAGKIPDIAIDVEYGSSTVQGTHVLTIDAQTLAITKAVINESQGAFHDMAEIGNLATDQDMNDSSFEVDMEVWEKKGYKLTDMAEGESPVVFPPETDVLKGME